MKGQVAGLVFPGFVSRTGLARLAHLPRYLQGALDRVRGLCRQPRPRPPADDGVRARRRAVTPRRAASAPPPEGASAALVHARWLLEEYRISLFAQSLGTAEPVSPQRIQKALRE